MFGAAILVTGCGRNPIAPAEDTYFSESWEDDYNITPQHLRCPRECYDCGLKLEIRN
ncbi:MAG: hypothetical protein QME81_09215 [bacterium]|nr:hypothetical protein [bacterium]